MTVSEPTADGVRGLAVRFAGDPRVTCRTIDFTRPPPGEYSAVYAVNVLEHVADDVGALAGAAALVRAGGKVVVFVPAFPSAMSRFDRELGHYRRYTRETTHRAFVDAETGARADQVRERTGPASLVCLDAAPRQAPSAGLALRLWDRLVVPVARAVEARVHPPFGQSVLAVGRVERR